MTSSSDADPGGAGHPRGLVGLHVDGDLGHLEQAGDALDAPPHHVAADVVGVVVGGQDPDALHAVGRQHAEQLVDAVGGVDDHRLAGLPVSDQVDEVDHLPGHLVVGGEVPPGQQLAEVEAVGGGGVGGIHWGVGHPPTLRSTGPSRNHTPASTTPTSDPRDSGFTRITRQGSLRNGSLNRGSTIRSGLLVPIRAALNTSSPMSAQPPFVGSAPAADAASCADEPAIGSAASVVDSTVDSTPCGPSAFWTAAASGTAPCGAATTDVTSFTVVPPRSSTGSAAPIFETG